MTRKPDGETSRLDSMLCFTVYSTAHAFNRAYKPLLDVLELTYPQYLAMFALWEKDNITVKEMGERLHLDSGTLTPLLKRLQAQGAITRERDTADERRVIVRLTDAGRQLKIPARKIPPQVGRSTGCELAEIVELTRQLTTMRGALSHAAEAPH